jgi:hypothetical protein
MKAQPHHHCPAQECGFRLVGRSFREEFNQRLLHGARGRKKRFRGNMQRSGQAQQLVVGDAADLSFDLRKGAAADVPPLQTDARSQLVLSQTELESKLSNLGSDDILPGFHASRSCQPWRRSVLRYRSRLRLLQSPCAFKNPAMAPRTMHAATLPTS